jgi:hypothetical protein
VLDAFENFVDFFEFDIRSLNTHGNSLEQMKRESYKISATNFLSMTEECGLSSYDVL